MTPPHSQTQTTLYDRPALDQGRASALVLDATCAYYRLPLVALTGRGRANPAAIAARRVAAYLLVMDQHDSLTEAGGALGGRDHSTVAYYLTCVARDLVAVPAAQEAVEAIREEVAIRTGQRANVTWLEARDQRADGTAGS